MQPAAPSKSDNTHTIARNSFWYGTELVFTIIASLITSILVARVVGPQRLGYYNFVMWLTSITTTLGGVGLPMTTRKYMAECLNKGEAGVARAIYEVALKLQSAIALLLTAAAVALVFALGDPAYRAPSLLLAATIAPRMIGFIPSQANGAAEMMKRNTGPALIGGMLTVGLTLAAIAAGWDLTGVAASLAAGSLAETSLKLRSVWRFLRLTPAVAISSAMKRRMFSYSGEGLALMVLGVVIWDRSDMVILKAMNPDVRQLAFFSLAFNLTERILLIPSAFSNSLGLTMMAQYGRDRERVERLAVDGARYALLIALPLLAGVACVCGPFVSLLYGQAYLPLIPVLAVTALLAIPKALAVAPTSLLQTTEKQRVLIWIGCACGAVDIGLDFLLTGRYGALGAALANGIAQAAASVAVWVAVYRLFGADLQIRAFGRIALSGLGMAGMALLTAWSVPGYPGIALAIGVGILAWFAALRLTGAVDATDAQRLEIVSKALPARARPAYRRCLQLLVARV